MAVGVYVSPLGMYLFGYESSSGRCEQEMIEFEFFGGGGADNVIDNNDLDLDTFNINKKKYKVDACQVFSKTYEEARMKFRDAAKLIERAEIVTLPVFVEEEEKVETMVKKKKKNIQDEDEFADTTDEDEEEEITEAVVEKVEYTIDIAVIPGTSEGGLVVHSSGVHGIEGYAGSAIQIAALQAILKNQKRQQQQQMDDDDKDTYPTIIMIHGFNPYGMAKYRRFNENNVDLNRNGLSKEQWKSYATNHYNYDNYNKYDTLYNPQYEPTMWKSYVLYLPQMIQAIVKHGIPTLKAAMVGGQYHNPKGIFYGGNPLKGVEQSFVVLEEWLRTYLKKKSNDDSPNKKWKGHAVTWIDVHSGLGKFGHDTLLPCGRGLNSSDGGGSNNDKVDSKIASEFKEWFPQSYSAYDDNVKSDVNQGYEKVKGLMIDYYYPILVDAFVAGGSSSIDDDVFLGFVQEFGTLPVPFVGHALMVENAAYHFAFSENNKIKWAKRCLVPAFYPQNPSWRKSILEKGLYVFDQGMKRSKQRSSSSSK